MYSPLLIIEYVIARLAEQVEAISALSMSERQSHIYIMANSVNTVLTTGVTSDLKKRIWQHKEKQVDGFTQKYRVIKLVYYEEFDDIRIAIEREKQLKGGSRQKKIDLINSFNPNWPDLYDET